MISGGKRIVDKIGGNWASRDRYRRASIINGTATGQCDFVDLHWQMIWHISAWSSLLLLRRPDLSLSRYVNEAA